MMNDHDASMVIVTGVVVWVWVESVLALVGLVVALVVVLSLLDVWVAVLRVLPEQAEYYDEDYDERHHSDNDEPQQGTAVSCCHGGRPSVKVGGSEAECLDEQEEGEYGLDH